jgi:hypothetical protein
MGHPNGPRGCSSDKRRSKLHPSTLLLIVTVGSSSIAACALQSSIKTSDIQASPVLDRADWYSGLVGTRRAPHAESTDAQVDSRPALFVPKKAEPPKPQEVRRPPPFAFALSDNPPLEEQIYPEARLPVAPSTAASTMPAAPTSAVNAGAVPINHQENTEESNASSLIEWLQSLDSRSSNVQLLVAFLIGLTLGLLVSVVLLLRRRRPHASPDAQPSLDTDALHRALQSAPSGHIDEPCDPPAVDDSSTFERGIVEEHVLVAAAELPEASAEWPQDATLPSRGQETWGTTWTITSPQTVSPEPVVDLAVVSPARAFAPPAQLVEPKKLVPPEDLHRAGVLLEQGELEQSLAVLAPYVQEVLQTDRVQGDKPNSDALALARLYSNIRWKMAIEGTAPERYADAAAALEIFLAIKPDDTAALLRLAHCLLNQADVQPDELEKRALLQSCIDMLKAIDAVDTVPDLLRLGMLGEALSRRALLDVAIDPLLLDESEISLRAALAKGATNDSGVAWWLQQLLGTAVPGIEPALAEARLQESMVLLRLGLKSSESAQDGMRWQSTLMRAELEEIRRSSLNAASRRLRLRDLYSRYAAAMEVEQRPEVLAAWVELLCAMAASMVGNAALERYREIDSVLERLSDADEGGLLHATAWLQMMQRRLLITSEGGKGDLLKRAASILEPHVDSADEPLRLQVSKLALEQAGIAVDSAAQVAACSRALELARPLTAVPSLAIAALGCVLKALLALGEDKERRVYAKCLAAIQPDDAESLGLLARSAYRDGKFIDACQYFEMAWSKRDRAWPESWLDTWQDALGHWLRAGASEEACQRNQRQLRQADTRRFKPSRAA